MIENRDSDGFVADQPAQIAPSSARTPSRVPLFPLTRKIGSVDSRVVQPCNSGRSAAGIGVDLWLIGRNFQRPNHAKTKHPVFLVRQRNLLIERPQGSDAVNAPKVR